jgi:hypothetical protein
MVPVPIQIQQDSDKDEEKEKSKFSVFGAFFWAIVLISAFWFITGGYKALQ